MDYKINVFYNCPDNWDESLNAYYHSIYLTGWWLNCFSSIKVQPIYIDFRNDTSIVVKHSGLLIDKGPLRGKYIHFFSGPALKEINSALYLGYLEGLKKYCKTNRIQRLIVSSYEQSYSFESLPNGFIANQRTEFSIDLTTHSSAVYSKRFKNNLKKAYKKSPIYEVSNDPNKINSLLELVYKTQRHRIRSNRSKYNTLWMPFLTVNTLKDIVKNTNASFHSLKFNGRISFIALVLSNCKNKTVFLTGMDEIGYKNGFSSYMFDKLIDDSKKEGYKTIHLGGVPKGKDGENLSIFKESMGANSFELNGSTTNFLCFPLNMFNSSINLLRKLPSDSKILNLAMKFNN